MDRNLDYYNDRKYCTQCEDYVPYLMSIEHSYCAQCGGRGQTGLEVRMAHGTGNSNGRVTAVLEDDPFFHQRTPAKAKVHEAADAAARFEADESDRGRSLDVGAEQPQDCFRPKSRREHHAGGPDDLCRPVQLKPGVGQCLKARRAQQNPVVHLPSSEQSRRKMKGRVRRRQ